MKTLYKNIALFVGGSLFGSAGVKLLGSKDAKNAYTHAAAAVLRMKDCVMNTVDTVRENADDMLQRTSTSSALPRQRLPQRRSRTAQRRSQTRWLLTLHRPRHNLHQSNQKGGRNVPLFPSFPG